MECAPTAVIGPTQAARPIGHHCWKKYILPSMRMSSPSRTFFCLGALGLALRHHRRGGFSQLSALSRVISLDLIDLDARVGTRVRSFSETAVSPTASTSDAGRPRTPLAARGRDG